MMMGEETVKIQMSPNSGWFALGLAAFHGEIFIGSPLGTVQFNSSSGSDVPKWEN